MLNYPVYIPHLSCEMSWHERRGFSSCYVYETHSSSVTENRQPLTNWNKSNIFFSGCDARKHITDFYTILHPHPLSLSLPPSIIYPLCHLKLSIKTIQTCMLKKYLHPHYIPKLIKSTKFIPKYKRTYLPNVSFRFLTREPFFKLFFRST